jgi:hypothetical protein
MDSSASDWVLSVLVIIKLLDQREDFSFRSSALLGNA